MVVNILSEGYLTQCIFCICLRRIKDLFDLSESRTCYPISKNKDEILALQGTYILVN